MADRVLAGMLATHRQHESARRTRANLEAEQRANLEAEQRARFAELYARILEPIITEHQAQLADADVTLTTTVTTSKLTVQIHDQRRPPIDGTFRLDVGATLDSDVRVAFDRLLWLGPDSLQWCSALEAPDVVDLWTRSVLHGFYRHYLRSAT